MFTPIVAGGRNQYHPLGPGIVDGVLEVLAEVRVAERHQDHVRAIIGSPDDPWMMSLSMPVPVASRTVTGMTFTPWKATPAIPAVVPGHRRDDPGQPRYHGRTGSVSPLEPSSMDVPAMTFFFRSGMFAIDAGIKEGHLGSPASATTVP